MVSGTDAPAEVINDRDEAHVISAGDDVVKLLTDAVRTLHPQAVKDLLSLEVCIRCIFRLFGVRECIYNCTLLSPSILYSILGKALDLEGDLVDNSSRANEDPSKQHSTKELEIEPNFCRICLGILQFVYHDDKNMLVRRDSAHDFAVIIAEVVKQGGHQIDNFSLEVSVPPSIIENEQAVRLYMQRKYNSEVWFREKFISECVPAKEFLKLSIATPLETLLGAQCGLSSFRIRLTFGHSEASIKVPDFVEKKECNKRRKTGASDDLGTAGIECSYISANENHVTKRSLNGVQDHDFPDCLKLQLEKVNEPCHLTLLCCRAPIYIGGRYLKYSRNVSQTRWIIDDERMGEASVEEIIGSSILPMCQGDNYKFHAAGREDIDVRMLGSGRPFLVEIQNARHVPSEVVIKETEGKMNMLENKLVKVKNLRMLGNEGWTMMREGEAEKQKQYTALVWISRPLKDDDLQRIASLKEMQILQRTPIRVLHRRSPLERQKVIHWMKIERITESSQYFLLHLCTQAGTYIKEFVHGDFGRTHPSIGSILGCRAEISQLDVTDVKMDCFLG
ncbi:uncharacterized protein LOC132276410 [Cornus florida]|uniref:uncharacterized protein LOC132276410 n=1 Tax=Cornus florida TaxID=4283 RepID=UPI00289966F8|nr:uncharacterized protein LOC132276410 [Cornus florida]XP_059633804.1 uncharacterized protein LOC132276410 [Cornus florida]